MIVRLSASSPPLLFFPKKRKTFTAKQAARADLAASFLLKDKKKNVYNKAGMTGGGRGIQ